MEENKKNTKLIIATIVSWIGVFGLSFLITEYNLFRFGELLVSVIFLGLLTLSIVLSVKLKKSKPKKYIDKALVDDNIIAARKIYKKKLHDTTFKGMGITAIIIAVIYVAVLAAIAIKRDILLLIIMASLIPFMSAVAILSYYVSVKHFFFKYREFIYNGESIVLFTSTPSTSAFVHPHFHVVYNGKEYSNAGNLVWTGFDPGDPGNLVFAVVQELIDWFNNDRTYSNFLRIDIDTEKSGKLQCVYKIIGGKFIVTDKLDMLKECFERSRPALKNKKSENNNDSATTHIDNESTENDNKN